MLYLYTVHMPCLFHVYIHIVGKYMVIPVRILDPTTTISLRLRRISSRLRLVGHGLGLRTLLFESP